MVTRSGKENKRRHMSPARLPAEKCGHCDYRPPPSDYDENKIKNIKSHFRNCHYRHVLFRVFRGKSTLIDTQIITRPSEIHPVWCWFDGCDHTASDVRRLRAHVQKEHLGAGLGITVSALKSPPPSGIASSHPVCDDPHLHTLQPASRTRPITPYSPAGSLFSSVSDLLLASPTSQRYASPSALPSPSIPQHGSSDHDTRMSPFPPFTAPRPQDNAPILFYFRPRKKNWLPVVSSAPSQNDGLNQAHEPRPFIGDETSVAHEDKSVSDEDDDWEDEVDQEVSRRKIESTALTRHPNQQGKVLDKRRLLHDRRNSQGFEPILEHAQQDSTVNRTHNNILQALHAIQDYMGAQFVAVNNRLDVISHQLAVSDAAAQNLRIAMRNRQNVIPSTFRPLKKTILGHGVELVRGVFTDVILAQHLVPPREAPQIGAIPPEFHANFALYTPVDIIKLIIFYNDDFGIPPNPTIATCVDKFQESLVTV